MRHLPVRSIALFLAFFICFSILPLPVFAETEEATTETSLETTVESTSEPAAEPPTEAATETATDPSAEPATEPSAEPVTEPTTEPSTEPVTEPLPEAATETTLPAAEETQPETIAPVAMDPIGGQLSPGQTVTLSCPTEGASIYYAVSYDGETYSEFYQYVQPLLPEADFSCFCVKAYAVKMGLPDGPVTEAFFTGTPTPPQAEDGLHGYFGLLHTHSSLSAIAANRQTPEALFSQAAQTAGLDFLAVTDYSHAYGENDWGSGKAAAAAASCDSFLGLWGYEMAWQDSLYLGHICTYAADDFLSRSQPEFSNSATALENYYAALSAAPGAIGQFAHPSLEFSFQNFSHHSLSADGVMNLIELPESMDCEFYQKALNAGWHVAPTFPGSTLWDKEASGRTVVLASALTEPDFYEALRNRRVYATTDSDLLVDFRLNGAAMGSILSQADSANITLSLSDPTDPSAATVTLVTATRAVTKTYDPATEEPLSFQLPANEDFYYIQLLQPDGDMAVTAPVWIRQPQDLGISGLSQDAAIPVQNQPLNITLELYNNETLDFTAEAIEFYIGSEKIKSMPAMTVAPGQTERCTFSYTHASPGLTTIRAEVSTTINGEKRTFSQELDIRFHIPEQISTIFIEGHYSEISAVNLQNLTALASESNIFAKLLTDPPTAEDLLSTGLLILPPPKSAYSDAFMQNLREFVQNGGNLILWSQSLPEGNFDAAGETNRLLSHLGMTLRLLPGTVTDGENNGGSPELLYPSVFNKESSFCDSITQDQVYCHRSGCAVAPGSGEWLVKGFPSTYWGEIPEPVLLAREATISGGTILLAGSPFLTDSHMPLPQNSWEAPRINQSILMTLLDIPQIREELPVTSIREVRNGTSGQVYRIRGYVTAGTAKAHNSFPGTLYLQDDTGGIAVVPFHETGIPQNAHMEIIGYREEIQGNTVLYLIDDTLITKTGQAADPKTIPNREAMDYASHGGELLQIEGTAISITYTANKKGVSRFVLKDKNGDLATVLIESYIGAGSSGENTLAEKVLKGKNVRVRGILHIDASNTPVLRVRNCEEVVYVPPIVTPNTGDRICSSVTILALSALGLSLAILLRKKKQ